MSRSTYYPETLTSCYVSSPSDRRSVVFWCVRNPVKRLIESVHTSVGMKGVRTAHCIHIKFDIGELSNFFEKFDKTKEKFTLKLNAFGAYLGHRLLNTPKKFRKNDIDKNKKKTFSNFHYFFPWPYDVRDNKQ